MSSFHRGLIVVGVYLAIFLSLILVQFSRNTGFTFNVGSIALTGRYSGGSGSDTAAKEEPGKAGRGIAGPLSVYFGGMEFRLSEADGLAALIDGQTKALKPVAVATLADGVKVKLDDGSEIQFSTLFIGGNETLNMSAALSRNASEIKIPYRPSRSAKVVEKDGNAIIAVGNNSFTFLSATLEANKRLVSLKRSNPVCVYGKYVQKKAFSASDFILAAATDQASYDSGRSKWLDNAFAAWERLMSATPDEDSIVAYTAESARRGNYRSAVATAPKSFIDGDRGPRSAVYYGRVDEGYRNMLATERELLGRLSRLENERNIELFAEQDLISYTSVRASKTMVDDIATFVRALDPGATKSAQAIGFFECWTDWNNARADQANPFDKLLDQAGFVLTGQLKKAGDGSVLLATDNKADILSNLRAGRALIRYSQAAKDRTWGDVGRSLILSTLALTDSAGTLPTEVAFVFGNPTPQPTGTSRIPASRVYRYAGSDSYLPRAIPLLNDGGTLLWAWTAAPCTIVKEESVIDISVEFFEGASHFMILRGLKPFKKIQLYGIDYSTDIKFERYDSSGWAYFESEQTMLLKMKHRERIEHIRIFY